MTELDEIRSYAEESVPQYQLSKVIEALNKNGSEIEIIGRSLTGERYLAGFVTQAAQHDGNAASFYDALKNELYIYFCTNDSKYEESKKSNENSFKIALPTIAAYLCSSLGLSVSVVAGALSVASISMVKIGINVWCETQGKSAEKIN